MNKVKVMLMTGLLLVTNLALAQSSGQVQAQSFTMTPIATPQPVLPNGTGALGNLLYGNTAGGGTLAGTGGINNLLPGLFGPGGISSSGGINSALGGLLGPGSSGLLSGLLGGGLSSPGSLLNGSVVGNLLGGGGLGSLLQGSPLAGLLGGGSSGLLSGLLGGSPVGGLLSGSAGGLLSGLLGGGGGLGNLVGGLLGGGSGASGGLGGMIGGLLGGGGGLGGMLSGLMGGGGLTGMLSMIPGMQWIGAAGPLLGAVMNSPIGQMLGSIPGIGQILGLLGMGSPAANLAPLTKQMNDAQQYTSSIRRVAETTVKVVDPRKFESLAGDMNGLMRMSGSRVKFTKEQVKANPEAVATAAIHELQKKQNANMASTKRAATPEALAGLRTANDILEQMKQNAVRNATNSLALQEVKKTADETASRAQENVQFRQETSRAVNIARKQEDILKLNAAIQLEEMRMAALNSAALTSALANQTAVEVAQAESLNGILDELRSERLAKANALMRMQQENLDLAKQEAQRVTQYTDAVSRGITRTMSGQSLKDVDLSKKGQSASQTNK